MCWPKAESFHLMRKLVPGIRQLTSTHTLTPAVDAIPDFATRCLSQHPLNLASHTQLYTPSLHHTFSVTLIATLHPPAISADSSA